MVSNNAEVAVRVRQLRVYGEAKRYHHEVEGTNSRLDEIQAAILRIKLRHLGKAIEERQKLATIYDDSLSSSLVRSISSAEWAESACHLYVAQCSERDLVQRQLDEAGIRTLIHYPIPIHLQRAYDFLPYSVGDFPVTEAAAKRILSLPLYPGLHEETVRRICSVLNGIG
ncbi:MAG: DegT/DnrJ/EryC1/StrS family aminotransferase [Candidatus Hydrogenedentota bacterium]